MTDWSDFDAPVTDFPEPFKWDTVGASIAGIITRIRKATFDDSTVPELWIQTEQGERSVLCGPANLITQLLERKPEVGDYISITYVSQKKATKGFSKQFEVKTGETFDAGTFTNPSAVTKTADDLL